MTEKPKITKGGKFLCRLGLHDWTYKTASSARLCLACDSVQWPIELFFEGSNVIVWRR